ncbi:MAG: phosphoribosyltransferase family protein [Gallionellaceae bacterium]
MSILHSIFLNICTKIVQMLPEQPCLLCGTSSAEVWCPACDASLPALNSALCPVCALPTFAGDVCGSCLTHPPHFKSTIAVYAYAFPLDRLVLALKYGEKFHLAKQMGDRLAQRVRVRPDCLVAMPLHPVRLRERGFNQSLQLARHIAQRLGLPLLATACQRVRNTPSQSTLPWKERGKNMRKAFSCSTEVAGKHVAVVDDVMTTGATLNELALALLNAGATEVSVWVVARTLPHTRKP